MEWVDKPDHVAGILGAATKITVLQSTGVDDEFARSLDGRSGKSVRLVRSTSGTSSMTASQALEEMDRTCQSADAVIYMAAAGRQGDNNTLGMAGGYVMGRVAMNYRFDMVVMDCATKATHKAQGIGRLSAATFEMAEPKAAERLGGKALADEVVRLIALAPKMAPVTIQPAPAVLAQPAPQATAAQVAPQEPAAKPAADKKVQPKTATSVKPAAKAAKASASAASATAPAKK